MYKYSEFENVFSKNKYFYSDYRGKLLIDSYLSSRTNLINIQASRKSKFLLACYEKIKKHNIALLNSFDNEIGKGFFLSGEIDTLPIKRMKTNSGYIDTHSKLSEILTSFKVNIDQQGLEEIELLLKRFEVSKKIFSEYQSGFSKGRGNINTVDNYILFSKILACILSEKVEFRLLSCMLKVNDTICGLVKKASSSYSDLSSVLLFEILLIKFLFRERVSKIDFE